MKSTLLFFAMLFVLVACENAPQEKAAPTPSTETSSAEPVAAPAEDLSKLGISNHPDNRLGGLAVGEMAPAITGKDQDGNDFNLKTSLNDGPVVLIFYRGYWCGYCNQQLEAFEAELENLKSKGVKVVAISPETNEYAKKTVEKTGTSISILSDGDRKIMEDYKVAFQVTDAYSEKVKKYVKKDLTEMSGHASATLPVPATYVIGKDGKVAYTFYDPDYSKRASVKDILAVL